MAAYERKSITIDDLLVNPENKRYIEPVEDEIQAIIAMFTMVVDGKPKEEMVNMAKDLSENGLNPFEQPIVWYDDEYKNMWLLKGTGGSVA